MQRQIAITEAIAIIEGTIYFFISQSFFLYRFSFFSASIGLSFLILLIEYIMVTNTTRNTLSVAMPIAVQGRWNFVSIPSITARYIRYVTPQDTGKP